MKLPGLILSRNVNETIHIGDNVIVTVIGVKGQQVKLHIAADKSIEVHRGEIYNKIQSEKSGTTEKE